MIQSDINICLKIPDKKIFGCLHNYLPMWFLSRTPFYYSLDYFSIESGTIISRENDKIYINKLKLKTKK